MDHRLRTHLRGGGGPGPAHAAVLRKSTGGKELPTSRLRRRIRDAGPPRHWTTGREADTGSEWRGLQLFMLRRLAPLRS